MCFLISSAKAAAMLGAEYDVEIVEQHHRFKKDAPSGSALTLSKNIAAAEGWPWPDCLVHGRNGKEALRTKNTIGMHAVRAGDIVGEHEVIFSTLGETVTLSHSAHNRDNFARRTPRGRMAHRQKTRPLLNGRCAGNKVAPRGMGILPI